MEKGGIKMAGSYEHTKPHGDINPFDYSKLSQENKERFRLLKLPEKNLKVEEIMTNKRIAESLEALNDLMARNWGFK